MEYEILDAKAKGEELIITVKYMFETDNKGKQKETVLNLTLLKPATKDDVYSSIKQAYQTGGVVINKTPEQTVLELAEEFQKIIKK